MVVAVFITSDLKFKIISRDREERLLLEMLHSFPEGVSSLLASLEIILESLPSPACLHSVIVALPVHIR